MGMLASNIMSNENGMLTMFVILRSMAQYWTLSVDRLVGCLYMGPHNVQMLIY